MSVRVTERQVDTVQGPKKAWISEPREHIVVGRERLARFHSEGHPGSDLDRELLAAIRAIEDPYQLVIFRTTSDDGKGSWSFDPALNEEETKELGYHLVLDQLPTCRRMVAAGVFAILSVELGSLEVDAFQAGTRRLISELEAGSIPEELESEDTVSVLQVDRWILHHLSFFFTLGLEEIVDTVLKKQLPWLEDRIPHLRSLVASLPEAAID